MKWNKWSKVSLLVLVASLSNLTRLDFAADILFLLSNLARDPVILESHFIFVSFAFSFFSALLNVFKLLFSFPFNYFKYFYNLNTLALAFSRPSQHFTKGSFDFASFGYSTTSSIFPCFFRIFLFILFHIKNLFLISLKFSFKIIKFGSFKNTLKNGSSES